MRLIELCAVAVTLVAVCAGAAAGQVKPVVKAKVQPFALKDVRLLDSPFKHAMELNEAYLLKLEADRLLAGFRKSAGLTPRGEVYGGWESSGLAGHSLGHYLTALSLMYASTGNKKLLERVNYIVDELDACQKANGDGYVEAIPDGKRIFAEIAKGDVRSAGFDLNGMWVPWYNIHKLYAGLLDAHELCGSKKALDVVKKLGDWTIAVTANLDEEKFQRMLACEHGGMNESFAQLYAVTGEKKYLEMARKFCHKAILDPLAARQDNLPGKHANTQIPKIIGAARLYELAGEKKDAVISEFFWETVVKHHSYVIGGNSLGEHFGPADKLADRLGDNTTETCNTYNMLKLSRHLFCWHADAKYADYYERALYNHILASQNPHDGMMCYFVPLRSGGQKGYSTPFDSFWCCVGTGIENHAKYGDSIYFNDGKSLFVNLFIPSELKWGAKGVTVTQKTEFPAKDTTQLTFTCSKPVDMPVNVRYPSWAKSGITVSVNGKAEKVTAKPGSYVTVTRKWQTGDRLEVKIPMGLWIEPMPDKADRAAILYGPVVLAARLQANQADVPVLVTDNASPEKWLKPVAGQALTFRTQSAGKPSDVTMVPFYQTQDCKYAVYWDFYTREDWAKREAEVRAEEERRRELDARTVDLFNIGEMQPERDHNLQSENSSAGDYRGRKWRDARNGWFSFEVKVSPDKPVDLVCTYWGGEPDKRIFDILANGEKIATQTLQNDKPGVFFDVVYPIPEALTEGKEKVTIRMQSIDGSIVGGLFGCRVVTRK